ncbi:MAG: hypothetical protein II399_01425 [Lachnospiraceae bacterium]|nr:hypothetical protein [Lachnospiraceae bacterium]
MNKTLYRLAFTMILSAIIGFVCLISAFVTGDPDLIVGALVCAIVGVVCYAVGFFKGVF